MSFGKKSGKKGSGMLGQKEKSKSFSDSVGKHQKIKPQFGKENSKSALK